MHVPALLPEELLAGYLQRLMHLNGVASDRSARDMVDRMRDAHPAPGLSMLDLIARICEIDVAHLIRAHTLVPEQQLIVPGWKPLSFGDARFKARDRQTMLAGIAARHCDQCRREDVAFWGFPYARRSAQLPGIDWCTKHRTSLRRPCEDRPSVEVQLSTAEHRYSTILEGLVDAPHAIPSAQASLRLKRRMQELGFRTRSDRKGKSLKWWVFEVMPPRWVRAHLPLRKTAINDGGIDEIHIAAMRQVPTHRYALALTLLYEEADLALKEFLSPLTPEELAACRARPQARPLPAALSELLRQ